MTNGRVNRIAAATSRYMGSLNPLQTQSTCPDWGVRTRMRAVMGRLRCKSFENRLLRPKPLYGSMIDFRFVSLGRTDCGIFATIMVVVIPLSAY
ncbi:hypothetical protein CA54_17520 [Symmachiella macrocystis]|uniref:Uncharacterized protein n=1 Tax=Symmachiella macrocystis TaxID=2527985 RepID=A0A5C6BNS6_9PLAN|nr:hypothetical protein CA54_17520 [Symmachiella macrocystis]